MLKTKDILDEKDKRLHQVSAEVTFPLTDTDKKNIDLMEEYLNESEKVITDINFGESYDKELALKDLGRQEGEEIGILRGKEEKQLEIAKNMLKDIDDYELISKYTGLDIETIQKLSK